MCVEEEISSSGSQGEGGTFAGVFERPVCLQNMGHVLGGGDWSWDT